MQSIAKPLLTPSRLGKDKFILVSRYLGFISGYVLVVFYLLQFIIKFFILYIYIYIYKYIIYVNFRTDEVEMIGKKITEIPRYRDSFTIHFCLFIYSRKMPF